MKRVCSVARIVVLEWIRGMKRSRTHLKQGVNLVLILECENACGISDEQVEELYFHIGRLPDRLRETVLLDLEGLSYEEIASAMTVKEGTVRKYRSNAVVRLSELMSS